MLQKHFSLLTCHLSERNRQYGKLLLYNNPRIMSNAKGDITTIMAIIINHFRIIKYNN